MLHRLALISVLSTGFLVTASCGGEDIDVDQTLDDLGEAGLDRVCEEARQTLIDMYSSSLMTQFICTADAIEKTTTAEDCATQVDACISNPPPSAVALLDQILAQAGCSAVTVETDGCLAPVSQLTGCIDALEGEIDRVQFTGTCAAAGQPVDDGWWQISIPAVCTSVDSEC